MTEIDPMLRTLARGLAYSFNRQRLLAGNIANAETPGFVRKDIAAPKFSELVRAASAGPENEPPVLKGGPVVLEKEMADSSANSLYYSTLTRLASARMRMAELAIRGR